MSVGENNVIVKRKTNRWLMVFYDLLSYIACSFIILALFRETDTNGSLYSLLGCAMCIAVRLAFGVYKMILRYGTVNIYARVIFSDIISGGTFLGVAYLTKKSVPGREVPFMTLVCVVCATVLAGLAIRILYYYVYRFAMKKSRLSRVLRQLLDRFALVDFSSKTPGATKRLSRNTQSMVPIYVNELQWIIDKFAIRGQIVSINQMNRGYINRTYKVETLSETGHIHKYTLQRINTNVFKDVDALMDNYKLVTRVLYGTLRLKDAHGNSAVPTLKPTKDGRSYLLDESGCWRMMTYFDGVHSLDVADSAESFGKAGYAFGNFIKAVEDIDINSIKEVIPNFHNTKSRYADLEKSIEEHKDGRVAEVQEELAFIRAHSGMLGMIADALEKGEIPRRICHNDTNLNNVLFDDETDSPVAIIDLDTVMPSSPLYDFGDSMRIGTNTAKDDEKDLSKVSCDLEMYEEYARGYLRACGDILTVRELELLPYAAMIITFEDGIRFLMDHVDGDIYYSISYPGQNLDRARTQLKLAEDMERKLPEIKRILSEIYEELDLKVTL